MIQYKIFPASLITLLISIVAFFAVTLIVSPSHVFAQVAPVSINPSQGPVGTDVGVSGTGWTPGDTVTIRLNLSVVVQNGVVVGSDGSFDTDFVMPNEGNPGEKVFVEAYNTRDSMSGYSYFTITGQAAPQAGQGGAPQNNLIPGAPNVPATQQPQPQNPNSGCDNSPNPDLCKSGNLLGYLIGQLSHYGGPPTSIGEGLQIGVCVVYEYTHLPFLQAACSNAIEDKITQQCIESFPNNSTEQAICKKSFEQSLGL